MSCLDVMYHQSYAAHYLPAAAYKATCYNHHQQQQQRRLSVYSKMQECYEQQQQTGGRGMPSRDQAALGAPSGRTPTPESEQKDSTQPTETEYLGSRCVLFTYFQGEIGDVVDEHFSRALSQSSTFSSDTKQIRVSQPSASNGPWKDCGSEAQSAPVWNGAYPAQSSSCLPSLHPDFTPSPVSFNHPDGTLWADHVLTQGSLPPPSTLPDSWAYSLNSQSSSGYPGVHNIYHPHPHLHSRHHHPMLHSYPTHSPALDPRFSPLLLPSIRNQNQASASAGSPPHSEGVKTEMDSSGNSPLSATSVTWTPPALHGSLDMYDSAVDPQTKAKAAVWF
ncbi:hypothetical protein fugu_000184 [Takifugu bimaculatus]|uniref:Transcription cofactor vestigial-like protein 3 n=1 Tax=Takifugu bimaculatus TaxID=433685 RepID=A0A4Z2CG73_9TELE|nr:hypothetical protein fugu_000184 [Takifugu bimaculatus]